MTRRSERGAAATEFALIVPILVLLAGVVVGGGRVWFARASVDEIAHSASRAASLARSAGAADAAAHEVAAMRADSSGLRCSPLRVAVGTGGFAVPVGQPASVSVSVTCRVPLSDILVPGWPGSIQVAADATSVLDRYRERR